MNKKYVKIVAFVIVITMIVTSFSFIMFLPGLLGAEGYVVYATTTSKEQKELDGQLFELESYIKYIHDNYKDKVNYQTLIEGAFSGAVDVLDDPYSVYYSEKEVSDSFQESVSGQFNGIGIQLDDEDGKCIVVSPIRNTPAEKAGIKSGDIIVKVDGKDVTALTGSEIALILRGPAGTVVKLTVDREGKQLDFTITRALISEDSVTYELLPENIGYISISSFDADTDVEFKAAKKAVVDKGAKSIILDVRNNPGGYVNTAIGVANEILGKGTITIFQQQGKTIDTYTATSASSLSLPMVLLVNEGSASSSEILAGALKDNKAATLVGTTTYGKGIAQQIGDLQNGGSIKLSMYYFVTPKGNTIHGIGVSPDYTIRNMTGKDTKALKLAYDNFAPMAEKTKAVAGSMGLNVYAAQQRLALLGFKVQPTAVMDEATVNAVKAFQNEQGIASYGALDYTTMNQLETAAHDYAYGVSTEDKQLEKAIELLK